MANLFFSGNSSTGTWDELVEAAFNQEADFALRDAPVWGQVVDTRPKRQAMPGESVTFTIHQDLGATTPPTALTETTDPDAVAPQDPTRVTVTLAEYGRATLATAFLDTLAFTQAEKERAVIVGRDLVDSYDGLIRAKADTSTNTIGRVAGTVTDAAAVADVTATDTMNRNLAAAVVSYLRGDKVMPKSGDDYLAICHPFVLHDLMAENSATAWIGPHTYGTDTNAVYNAEVGKFMGARYLSTTRVKDATDGDTSAHIYRSYFVGQQAIAEAVAIDPHIVVGPIVDKLKRFRPLGWHGLFGHALYRPEALRKVYSASSLG